jgi:hypothetical protein
MGARKESPTRLDPRAKPGRECSFGSSTVLLVAAGPLEARQKAEAQLADLGALPGGPRGVHESFRRMYEFATRGRR